jgi:hypothetical protein
MIEAGEGRTMGSQALMQFIAVAITLGIAIVTGVVTGLFLAVINFVVEDVFVTTVLKPYY